MFYDAETIQHAMARAGRLAQSDLALALADFEKLGLSPDERLAAVTSAIAAAARKRHADRSAVFLKAIRDMTRPVVGYFGGSEGGALFLSRVIEGVRVLNSGLDRLTRRLVEVGQSDETAAIVETVMLARLLAAHRPHQISLALLTAGEAISRADYAIGDIVSVGIGLGEAPYRPASPRASWQPH